MKRIGKIEPNVHRQICGGCNIEMYRSKKDQRVMCCDFCGITVPANDVKPVPQRFSGEAPNAANFQQAVA